jgi:hypothetical protein
MKVTRGADLNRIESIGQRFAVSGYQAISDRLGDGRRALTAESAARLPT